MNRVPITALLLSSFLLSTAYASMNLEYRGGWDSFPSSTKQGTAQELLHNGTFSPPPSLINPDISNGDLNISASHSTSIDFHGTLKTPQYETGAGRGQGFMYVMGLENLTVKSGWQTLVSNEFTWSHSTWSVAIDTSKGLNQTVVQGFWRNSGGVVSTYLMGTVDLSNFNQTTIAFGMQRRTPEGSQPGTFFYANGSNNIVSNGSLIAHNNGNPLGNGILGMGPVQNSTSNGNQGTFSIDNVYVYNMWTNSSIVTKEELQSLTSAAHARRTSNIPETSSATLACLSGVFFLSFRKRRKGQSHQ